MRTSEQTDKLDQALAKAQGEFKTVARDSKNPHYRSTYASLSAIWNEVRGPLAQAGISISQHPLASESPGKLVLATRIAHAGQWMISTCEVPLAKQDVQGWGAALTYAKRYALVAILGLADEDDDGETDAGRGAHAAPQKAVAKEVKNHAPQAKISPMQQVSAAISRHSRDRDLVGRWIRAAFPNVQLTTMSQAIADQIIQKIVDTPDEGFAMEIKDITAR